jgi:hypothetical protein
MSTIHNPTNFNPADYIVLGYFDNRPPEYRGQGIAAFEHESKDWRAELAAVYGPEWPSKIHHCAHCGNGSVRWITAVKHKPTSEITTFGAICTQRLEFEGRDEFALARLQARAETHAVAIKAWKKREAFLKDRPELAAAIEHLDEPVHADNRFVHDVIGKLGQYGSLSDRQVAAVLTSMAKDRERGVVVPEVKGDAPSGLQTVTGEVLSVKLKEGPYGSNWKMLLKLANGSKVWMTRPTKHSEIARGDVVTVRATFEVSREDKAFAFGSRPTVVKVESPAAAVVNVPTEPVPEPRSLTALAASFERA